MYNVDDVGIEGFTDQEAQQGCTGDNTNCHITLGQSLRQLTGTNA